MPWLLRFDPRELEAPATLLNVVGASCSRRGLEDASLGCGVDSHPRRKKPFREERL
jgi:hypothetical protein